jgi:hypothetical protein
VALLTAAGCTGADAPAPLPELPPRVEKARWGPAGEERPFREAVLAFTGEVRAEIEPCGCPTVPYGGFARRSAALEQLRSDGVPLFVLDAGLMLVRGQVGGPAADRAERGKAVLDLARATGLDAWAPSPVDLLVDTPRAFASAAALSATWVDASGAPLLPAATVLERGGFRLGVVGLSAPAEGTASWRDPVEATRAAIAAGGQADTWVALSNLDPADAARVAAGVPELGAVLSVRGAASDPPRKTEGAPVIETPDRGRYLTLVRLALGSDGAAWEIAEGAPFSALARERERVRRLERAEAVTAGREKIARLVAETAALAAGRDLAFVEERPLGSDLDGPSAVDERIAAFKVKTQQRAAERTASAPETTGYASSAGCTRCHDHAQRFSAWTLDPHSRAYATLIQRGEELNSECIACHSTGWGEPGGNGSLTADAMRTWKAVQCEACHGPLRGHPERADVKARPITPETCTGCHDAANSPQFDYASYVQRLSCTAVSRRASEQK